MKLFRLLFFLIATLSLAPNLLSQNEEGEKAGNYGMIQKPILVPSIAQQIKDGTFISVDPNETTKPGPPKRRGANITVPGKGLPVEGDALVQNQLRSIKRDAKDPLLVFDANTAIYTPSDPTGAVGPNHFVGGWNVGFR
ncbi:MAG: hypothetical protein COZ08_08925, partial [Bacteroidetes bacterium CG_4_10_14_3_um_filter_42_6]